MAGSGDDGLKCSAGDVGKVGDADLFGAPAEFGAVGAVVMPVAVGVTPGAVAAGLPAVVVVAVWATVAGTGRPGLRPREHVVRFAPVGWYVAAVAGAATSRQQHSITQYAGEQALLAPMSTITPAASSTTRRTCPVAAAMSASHGSITTPSSVSHRDIGSFGSSGAGSPPNALSR